MFMPFTIHVAMFCYRLIWNKTTCAGAGFAEACLHIPFVQTVRNLYNAWKLYKLGFGTNNFNPVNSAEVEDILKEVGLAG